MGINDVKFLVQENPYRPKTTDELIRQLRHALIKAEVALDHTASPQERRIAQVAVRRALDLPSVHEGSEL